MSTLTCILALFILAKGIYVFYRVYKMITTPFEAELRGDELIKDLLKKRVLIGQRKEVYVFSNDRKIWLKNAKQCLQHTE